jgi:guanosine-3',5'-bis(diphosphate) 3'-pyrophosphohydrolase
MEIADLKKFFNYKPLVETDVQPLLDGIKSTASSYLESDELEQIQACYEYAKKCHEGQQRQSGEPYIAHVVCATHFLMAIKPDMDTIKACLLHDIIEDCNITPAEIEKQFGSVVRKLCEGVTKVSTIKYR